MKRIVIFGGSGFIGRHVVSELIVDYEVIVVSRFKRSTSEKFGNKVKVERLRKTDITKIVSQVDGAFAVINLAGESVGVRWSESKMEKIRKSRLDVDSIVVRAIRSAQTPPQVVMLGSAIGIYGFSRDNVDITEETTLGQRGFLPKLAIANEEAFHQLEKLTRVVYLRTGLVLSKDDGALPSIALPFKLYVGGKIGNGKQWQSWIHIQDEVNAIKFLLENNSCSGPYNLTAPNPEQNKDFSRILARTLGKPNYLPIPGFALRLVMGTMANELLIKGLKVMPSRLIKDGYKFKFENLDSALENIYN